MGSIIGERIDFGGNFHNSPPFREIRGTIQGKARDFIDRFEKGEFTTVSPADLVRKTRQPRFSRPDKRINFNFGQTKTEAPSTPAATAQSTPAATAQSTPAATAQSTPAATAQSTPEAIRKPHHRTNDTSHTGGGETKTATGVDHEAVTGAGRSGVIDGGVERGAVPTPLGGQVARTSIFTTLPALSKRRPFFDSGRRTENFVGLIQRSNASYLSEINKFNATAGGALGPR